MVSQAGQVFSASRCDSIKCLSYHGVITKWFKISHSNLFIHAPIIIKEPVNCEIGMRGMVTCRPPEYSTGCRHSSQ